MDAGQLYDLYTNSLQSILNPTMMATLSDRKTNINGYNLVNRLLIYIQNKYATALRSEVGWETIGRQVKDKGYPIYILENIVSTSYIDPDNGEEIEDLDLSPVELNQAIEVGAIRKEKAITGLKCLQVFNIKDTVVIDSEIYRQYHRETLKKVKISTLLQLADKKYGVKSNKTFDDSYYDEESHTINIGNDGFDDKVEAISNGIFSTIHQPDLDKPVKLMLNVLRKFLSESLKSYAIPEHEVESSVFYQMEDIDFSDNDTALLFIELMYPVYDTMESVITDIGPQMKAFDECTLRKAAELLTILESAEAYVRLRG